MRTFDRIRANRGTPTNVTVRLVTMIAMLGVLVMLIVRARNPETWRWLANDHNDKVAKSSSAEAPIPDAVVTAPREPVSRGPTDTDVEELSSAVEEMQAISDGTLELLPEEMPAYWRLFSWADHQSFAVLQDRATKTKVPFNEFMQRPDVSRRRIVQLELNVRRVLGYPAPENSVGIKHVYEIVGPTDESRAWPYIVVTPHLPPGMPTGTDVHERVTFVGYFFKLQGYHAGGAAPNDKPLAAPLFIGRLSWRPSAARVTPKQDYSWVWWIGLVGLVYGGIRLGLWWRGRTKPALQKPRPHSDDAATSRLEEYFRSEQPDPYDFPPAKDELFDDFADPEEKPAPFFRRNGNPDSRGER